VNKHTLVIEGGQLGAAIAVALAWTRCGLSEPGWYARRDGRVQVYAYAPAEDKGARSRWVKACRDTGLTVAPAPWERKAKVSA
jgi:hypothetical protein